jgi:hypothetical protein
MPILTEFKDFQVETERKNSREFDLPQYRFVAEPPASTPRRPGNFQEFSLKEGGSRGGRRPRRGDVPLAVVPDGTALAKAVK